jgi:hypothetical protein
MLLLNNISKQACATKDVDYALPERHPTTVQFIVAGKLVLNYASCELRDVFQDCIPRIKCDRTVI